MGQSQTLALPRRFLYDTLIMSLPFSTSSNFSANRPETPVASDTVPIKPFRPAPAFVEQSQAIYKRLRILYDDKAEWNRSLLIGVLMMIAIAASVVGRTGGTYIILALFVSTILLVAATDAWAGLLLFLVYASMEGMFKYTTLFSSTVYALAPVMAVYIFVVWRITSRTRENLLVTQQNTQVKQALISQKAEAGAGFPPVTPLVLALGLLHVVQIFNPEAAGLFSASAGTLTWYLAPMVLFFVSYFTVRNSKQLVALLYLIVAIGFVISAYAMVQYFLGETWCYTNIAGLKSVSRMGWFNTSAGGVEKGVFRPVSTFSGPGGYVFFSEFGIIASILVAQMDKMPTWRRVLVLGLAGVMAVAMIIAGIRIVLVNSVIIVVLILALSVRSLNDAVRIYFFSFLIFMAGTAAFLITDSLTEGKIGRRIGKTLTDPFSSFKKNRGYHFHNFVDAVSVRPFGIGVQRTASDWRTARQYRLRAELIVFNNRETQWNAIHNDAGILGVILLGAVFVVFTRDGWLILQRVRHPRLRMVVIYFGAVVFSNFISSFGAPIMQSNFLFWIAAGTLYAVPRIYARENQFLTGSDTSALEPVTNAGTKPVNTKAI